MKSQAQVEDRLSQARLNFAVALTDEDRRCWLDCIEAWEDVIAMRRERDMRTKAESNG